MNFLRGVLNVNGSAVAVRLQDGTLVDLGGNYAFEATPLDGAEVDLGIRPELVRLDRSINDVALRFIGNITQPMGASSVVSGKVAEQPFALIADADREPAKGEDVDVYFSSSEASLFGLSGARL